MEYFFFNDTATTEIYTLSLHDALPIYASRGKQTARHSAGKHKRLETCAGGVNRSSQSGAAGPDNDNLLHTGDGR